MTLIPAMSGSIADMKKLRDACRNSGIAAEIGCPPGAKGGG
jgi:hypothetical protein